MFFTWGQSLQSVALAEVSVNVHLNFPILFVGVLFSQRFIKIRLLLGRSEQRKRSFLRFLFFILRLFLKFPVNYKYDFWAYLGISSDPGSC